MEGSVAIVSDLIMGCRQVGMGIVKKNSDPISREIEQLCKGFGKTSVNS